MSKNQKSKNNAITKLYNILDYNSKKRINTKNERYYGSLSQRLKEISGEEIYYRKKLDSKKPENGIKSLEPKVKIHAREIKKEPKIIEPIIEEKKRPFIDEDVFEIKKVKIKEPEFVEVKPKASEEEILELDELKAEKEKLPEWDAIETTKKEEEFKEISELESIPQEDIKKTETEIFEELKTKKEEIKDEQIPSFIPIKKVEEEKPPTEWEPIEIEKPKEEKISDVVKKEEKITVFDSLESINDKTASILFNNGIKTIDLLNKASIKELTKIKGIKKRTAKKIKKELKEKTIELEGVKPVEIEEIEKEDTKEEKIQFKKEKKKETDEWPEGEELESKTQVWESIEEEPEAKDTHVFEESSSEIKIEKPKIAEESKIEVFKDIKNIDKKTALLLFDNGYTSVDAIIQAPTKDLAKIKGIKKKKVKNIKKEIQRPKEIPLAIPIEIKEEKVKKDDFVKIKDELENSKKELNSISKDLNNKEKTIQKLQNELDEKVKELETKKTEIYNKEEEIKLLQDQSEQSKQELEIGLQDLNKKQEGMHLIEKELENIKLELETKNNEIDNRDEKIIELQNKLKEKNQKAEIESQELNKKGEEIEKIKHDLISKTRKIDEKNKIIAELQSELNEKQKNLERKDKEIKINEFKDVKSIDEETAILLYDNGIKTKDALKEISQKDLSKIKGIKRKTAKEIKKELDTISDKKVYEEPKTELEKKPKEYFVDKKVITNNLKMKKKKEQKEYITDENNLTSKEAIEIDKKIADEFSLGAIDENIFEGIESIDEKTSILLKENGISTIDALKDASIKDLAKIKGIKRKTAKKIWKEISSLPQEYKETELNQSFDQVEEETFVEEDEWEYYDEDMVSESKKEELKGFRYDDYGLYEKEIQTKSGNKRKVRFFSKAEPEDAEPIDLPKGYKVKKNKKTGLPYLRKKK
jgi:ERCC4-type nuclease